MPWASRCFSAAIALQVMGCNSGGTKPPEAQRAAVGRAVEEAWAEMMAGARALDPARIRKGYVTKPTVAINGVIVDDFDTQFEGTKHWLGSLRRLDATYDNVHLEVLTPDAVIATMNHHLRWSDTTRVDGEWHSAWTALFRRIDGEWKIAYSHESETLPARR
jgi:ketosteroid isomerase-like protein